MTGWGFVAVVLTATLLFTAVTLRVGVHRYSHWVARLVGRAARKLQGIELVVEHLERVATREARIVLLNHTSQLDLFIFAALFPPIATQDYSAKNVDAKTEEVHELFARRLEADTRASP